MSTREEITEHLWRLWDEAQRWEAEGFPSEPIVVDLRHLKATASPVGVEHLEGKKEHSIEFVLSWDEPSGPHHVRVTVGIQPDGDSYYFPYGGTRVLNDHPANRSEGDITWSEYKRVELVDLPIASFCGRELARACRAKKHTKFFKFKRPGDGAAAT